MSHLTIFDDSVGTPYGVTASPTTLRITIFAP